MSWSVCDGHPVVHIGTTGAWVPAVVTVGCRRPCLTGGGVVEAGRLLLLLMRGKLPSWSEWIKLVAPNRCRNHGGTAKGPQPLGKAAHGRLLCGETVERWRERLATQKAAAGNRFGFFSLRFRWKTRAQKSELCVDGGSQLVRTALPSCAVTCTMWCQRQTSAAILKSMSRQQKRL